MYIEITTDTKHKPDGSEFLARLVINFPFIGFVFGCKAKKNDGKPITNNSNKIN